MSGGTGNMDTTASITARNPDGDSVGDKKKRTQDERAKFRRLT
jgi:hypothetical protein